MVPPTLVEYCYTGVVRHEKFVTTTDAWKIIIRTSGRKKRIFYAAKKKVFFIINRRNRLLRRSFSTIVVTIVRKNSLLYKHWVVSHNSVLTFFSKKVLFTTENIVLEGENSMFFYFIHIQYTTHHCKCVLIYMMLLLSWTPHPYKL